MSDDDAKGIFRWEGDRLIVTADAFIENTKAFKEWTEPFGPDSPDAVAWAVREGWTAAEWEQSGTNGARVKWRAQWAARQAAKGETE